MSAFFLYIDYSVHDLILTKFAMLIEDMCNILYLDIYLWLH